MTGWLTEPPADGVLDGGEVGTGTTYTGWTGFGAGVAIGYGSAGAAGGGTSRGGGPAGASGGPEGTGGAGREAGSAGRVAAILEDTELAEQQQGAERLGPIP